MNDTHTPLPWESVTRDHKAIVRTVADSHVGKIAVMQSRNPLQVDEANAAYIVQACNNYPDALKALKAIVRVADQASLPGAVYLSGAEVRAARAAIKKGEA